MGFIKTRLSKALTLNALTLSICLAATPVLAEVTDDFQQTLSSMAASDDFVGLAAAVVRNGEVSMLRTYGVTQVGGEQQITANTRFRIASLSKAFAATVAVQLESEDKLSLDDPIISYNRDFRLKNQTQAEYASLKHVLSHRLSLPPYAYDNLLESGVSPQNILKRMEAVEPICNVGACYAYQNVAYNMIASAIEMVEKQSYAASVKQRVFEPLGMSGASFGIPSLTVNNDWARSYSRRNGSPWRAVTLKQPYYEVPAAGGVNANIVDMTKWLSAQMGNNPEVLSNAILERLHTPQTTTPRELRRIRHLKRITEAHYGLGWRIYNYAGATVVNHSGSVEGYGAQLAFLPDKNVGLILLTNSKSKAFWKILPAFLDQELGLSQLE